MVVLSNAHCLITGTDSVSHCVQAEQKNYDNGTFSNARTVFLLSGCWVGRIVSEIWKKLCNLSVTMLNYVQRAIVLWKIMVKRRNTLFSRCLYLLIQNFKLLPQMSYQLISSAPTDLQCESVKTGFQAQLWVLCLDVHSLNIFKGLTTDLCSVLL